MKAGVLALLLLAGCGYCKLPGHAKEPRCQIQAVASNCGAPAIIKVVEQILPQVVLALVNNDWSNLLGQLVNTLEQQGVSDALTAVTCAVSHVDINLSSVLGASRAAALSPPLVEAMRTHAKAWEAAHAAVK